MFQGFYGFNHLEDFPLDVLALSLKENFEVRTVTFDNPNPLLHVNVIYMLHKASSII